MAKKKQTYAGKTRLTKAQAMALLKQYQKNEEKGSSAKYGALVKEAKTMIQALEYVKEVFRRLDIVTNELAKFPPQKLAKDGLTLVDNFAEKNTAWKSTPFRRYDLKVQK